MHHIKSAIILFIIATLLPGCLTRVKNLAYLRKPQLGSLYINEFTPLEYKVKSNDNLYIRVIGEDELMTAFLNITTQGNTGNMGYGQNMMDFVTYIVDESGTISMPQIGRIHVEGLTIREIEEILNPKVNSFVTNTSVIVRVVNRTVTVLGEVKAPGTFNMLKYRQSIFESIGMAGDLTDYGNRKNVKLIREAKNGKQIVTLNLSDPQLVTSPWYYVQPGDIIYVEPRNTLYGTKSMSFMGPLPTFLSVFSTIIALWALL
jgi:polysaccharide export outer membrane protein